MFGSESRECKESAIHKGQIHVAFPKNGATLGPLKENCKSIKNDTLLKICRKEEMLRKRCQEFDTRPFEVRQRGLWVAFASHPGQLSQWWARAGGCLDETPTDSPWIGHQPFQQWPPALSSGRFNPSLAL